eukprot:TRINITY_DN32110_c0_g1_i1.p1 TRINITY_DN32110_c0_g1~~TRINITY_DN32110_c0_g1_i1.p1  ORF type:complete len:598 (-),score=122.87 TRINITY_DN32110_c0_g1_i1:208-2001(-)
MDKDKVHSVKVQPLADEVTKQQLQQAFRVFGEVVSVAIKSGANHKYGYINFRNPESALLAVQHHQIDVGGRPSFISHQQNPSFPQAAPLISTDMGQVRDKQKQRDMDQLKAHFSRKATVQQLAASYAKNQFDVDKTWEELLEENTGSESHGIPRVRSLVQGQPLKLMDETKTISDSRGYKLFDPHDWNAFEAALRRNVTGFLNGGGGRLIVGLDSHGEVAGMQPSPPDKKGRDRIRQSIDTILANIDPPAVLAELRFTVRFVPVHHAGDEASAIPNHYVFFLSMAEIPSEVLDNDVGVFFTDATRTEAFQRVNRIVQRMDSDLVKRRIVKANLKRKERAMPALPLEPQPNAVRVAPPPAPLPPMPMQMPLQMSMQIPMQIPMPLSVPVPAVAPIVVEVPTVSVGVPPVVPTVYTQLVPLAPMMPPPPAPDMHQVFQFMMPQTQAAIAAAPRQVVLAEQLEVQLKLQQLQQQQHVQQQQQQLLHQQQMQQLQQFQHRIALQNAVDVNDLEAKLLKDDGERTDVPGDHHAKNFNAQRKGRRPEPLADPPAPEAGHATTPNASSRGGATPGRGRGRFEAKSPKWVPKQQAQPPAAAQAQT